MKTLEQWFAEYSVSHQNPTNKRIHYICVPAIYFSIIGLLFGFAPSFLSPAPISPLLGNMATLAIIFICLFYLRLSLRITLIMLAFSIGCVLLSAYIQQFTKLAPFCLVVFALAWIGQFYGHHLEGKKPSFFKDLQFLLIGPAWVAHHVFTGRPSIK